MKESVRDRFKNILRNNGFKATPIRLALLKILEKTPKPVSVEEIRSKIKPSPDQATVYRALKEFEDSKMVAKLPLSEGYSVYEFLVGRSHHHHLVCCDCKINNN